MDQSVYDELTALIDALRAETQASSITPERLGAIIQQIVDILPELDDSQEIANVSRTALEAAQTAINVANSALLHANSAEASVGEVADNLASLANDVADAVENATTALYTAQQAAIAATAATGQVSQLATRVSTLEQFKTSTEAALLKTPQFHSASWLENEQGSYDEEHPERRAKVRYTSMKDAIEGERKLIKLYNFTAIGATVDSTNQHLLMTFMMADSNGKTSVSYYRVIPYSNYCVVEKTVFPMPYYDATWAKTIGGTRAQLDEFINCIQATPRCLMMAGNQPILWATMRNINVVHFSVMLERGVRVYTVEYNTTTEECNVSYEDTSFQ